MALRIPICTTCFAKVKLRLKTTLFETNINSCPEGKLFWGSCPGGILKGAIAQGVVVRGNLFRGNCPQEKTWGHLSWGISIGSNCSGDSCPGRIIWGKFYGSKSPGVIAVGEISWEKCPEGSCPGKFVIEPQQNVLCMTQWIVLKGQTSLFYGMFLIALGLNRFCFKCCKSHDSNTKMVKNYCLKKQLILEKIWRFYSHWSSLLPKYKVKWEK